MTTRTNKAPLHLAQERQNPYAEYHAGFHDLVSHAMDRALGVQKASLTAVVKMQNDVIEMQKHAFEGEPAIGNIFEAASNAYATCLEIQLSWLGMFVDFAKQGAEMWYQMAAIGSSISGVPTIQPQSAMSEQEEYEEEASSYQSAA